MKNEPSYADDPSTLADLDDPLIKECLRDALEPYLGVLSPEEIADQREFLTLFITTHPAAAPIYRRLRARSAATAASTVVTRDDAPHDEATAQSSPMDATAAKRRAQ